MLVDSLKTSIFPATLQTLKTNYPSRFEDPEIVPLQEFAWDRYLEEKKRGTASGTMGKPIPPLMIKPKDSIIKKLAAESSRKHQGQAAVLRPASTSTGMHQRHSLGLAKYSKKSKHTRDCLALICGSPLIMNKFALWSENLEAGELKGETWVYSSYVMCFINDQLLGNAFDLKKWAQKVWDVVDVRPAALYEALTLDYATKFLKDTKKSYAQERQAFLREARSFITKIRFFIESSRMVGSKEEHIVQGRGDDGESIYGLTFEDENFSIPHNKRGVLGMVNKGHHTNASQFYITLQATPYLDKKYVAFGATNRRNRRS
ncbi:Peptidylprolyl isomerase (Cyclophilin)-like 6 [Apodemus speciosus]|uniref:Peptidylprolyl isomerase (Cyclophilin)-like 6 n=1 Tax=Apodemus speciosus TaxID=105296 RepID=A0ABQ0F736_APOSI